MQIQNLNKVPSFITKDGSEIRELLAYRNSSIKNQSLAEARIPENGETQEHYHIETEEIYYVTHGMGLMKVGDETMDVRAGDAIAIPPGSKHKIRNTGKGTLHILCCCAPCYEDDDTILSDEV
ncbi:MAG: cupin domain-containing protein [Verrucomicrobia bacterium]|nr:cupin domain-containing protein [Verrucomicrobiota bacterium]MCF7707966.1 cupin domain-containing protein [Verrucomicrobiota bacterium]